MSSDVDNPPSVGQIVNAMRESRYNCPKALPLEVHAVQFGWTSAQDLAREDDVLTVLVVPTTLRVTYVEDYEVPEYEFEGWVLGPGEKPWVRGALRTADDGEIQECTIYTLEPGKELGTQRTPGIR
jgi:hypothetical protein